MGKLFFGISIVVGVGAYRRNLTAFWDREGELMIVGRGRLLAPYWFYRARDTIPKRLLILLPYLETALANELGYVEIRARNLFRLCLRGTKHAE